MPSPDAHIYRCCAFEVVPLCGCKGVTPVAQFLAQVKEDLVEHPFFPGRESEIN